MRDRKDWVEMSKANNMLAILWLLQSRGKMTAKQLADELEVHTRTVYRCIDSLCASGVPIVSDIGRVGGYYIPEYIKRKPLFFNVEEQKALLHAAQFTRDSGYPYEDVLEKAIEKLKRYTRPEQLQQLEFDESSLEVIYPPAPSQHMSRLKEIEKGIELQTSLVMNYRTGYDDSCQSRTIDPYGLVHWKNKWYIIGFCHLRGEKRTFRVDRISDCSRTNNTFERPPRFSAREFLLNNLLFSVSDSENHSGLVSVQIEGTPQAIDDICRHWLFGHALVERTANRAHFKINELQLYTFGSYYLLSFGGMIHILCPEELKEHMIDITSSLLEFYKS